MPDERLITEIENILNTVVELGAEKERTRMVPNLLVTNASPTGLSNFIIVKDDRDGDNILATKVPGIIYNTNDLVNVLFIRGGEAIAFQQGSGSSSSGLWEIVLGSSTDIYYNAGDVVIGKTSTPDAALEIVDSAQAQLRLTHTDATKFADFTVDTNHDLTIDPSSAGQIILAADDITIQEDLIHSGDTDTKMIFTADDIEFQAGGLSMLKLTEDAQDLIALGPGSGDVDIDFNGDMFLRGSDAFFGHGVTAPSNSDHKFEVASAGNEGIANTAFSTDTTFAGQPFLRLLKSHTGSIGSLVATIDGERLAVLNVSGVDSANALRATAGFRVTQRGAAGVGDVPSEMGLVAANNRIVMLLNEDMDVLIANNTSPTVGAQLHVDQTSSSAAQPVILLDQGDVDEPFIKYVGTAAAANLTRSIVDEGDVTTATRIGWVKIEIDDVGNQVTDGDYFMPFYSLA